VWGRALRERLASMPPKKKAPASKKAAEKAKIVEECVSAAGAI
jgi:hypothetical protein